MPFTFTSAHVPAGLETGTFTLRPITVADAERDYDAVMDSREYLRTWEQSSWPEDDFTIDGNRADLQMLEQRHLDGEAFTYTVTDPSGTECLGCVYLMATSAGMYTGARITPLADRRWSDYDAAVYYWVRRSRLGTPTDRGLLSALRRWLAEDWPFDGHLFLTNEQFAQQVELFGSTDLALRFTVEEAGKPSPYLAYE